VSESRYQSGEGGGPAPELSIIIPAYNEESRLPGSLSTVRSYLEVAGAPYEVLVVDDGSQDSTPGLLASLRTTWPQLQVLLLDSNRGKGAAVRQGMLRARGRLRLFSDSDLSTPIEDMEKLRTAIERGAEVAIGSRAVAGAVITDHQPRHRELLGRAYNRLLRSLVLPGVHDSQCGFKMFTARAAEICFSHLAAERFGFDAEVLWRARASSLPVAEVPVTWRNDRGTRVSAMRDGPRMLLDLARLTWEVHTHNSRRPPGGAP
jgi:dolichyl-phosphate beta-glucosyltransferase